VRPGRETLTFSMLVWDRYGFHEKDIETRHAKHLFLHSVGSAGRVVHSGASGARNVNARFFILGWDGYGFDKKHVRTH
jgi:hypothetical protein